MKAAYLLWILATWACLPVVILLLVTPQADPWLDRHYRVGAVLFAALFACLGALACLTHQVFNRASPDPFEEPKK